MNTYTSLPSTYPQKLYSPPPTHTHGITPTHWGCLGYKHTYPLCIWLLPVFLSYMIIQDKYLFWQFWVLHSHTLFIFPLLSLQLLLSRSFSQRWPMPTPTLLLLFPFSERENSSLRNHVQKDVAEAGGAEASERCSAVPGEKIVSFWPWSPTTFEMHVRRRLGCAPYSHSSAPPPRDTLQGEQGGSRSEHRHTSPSAASACSSCSL